MMPHEQEGGGGTGRGFGFDSAGQFYYVERDGSKGRMMVDDILAIAVLVLIAGFFGGVGALLGFAFGGGLAGAIIGGLFVAVASILVVAA
jgi:hypothetical protein